MTADQSSGQRAPLREAAGAASAPLRPRVFGIGLNKTGTKTLGQAMTILGYRNATFNGRLMRAYAAGRIGPIVAYARHYDSFEDWPWPLIYRQLAEAFPGSRFILTLRESPRTWLDSLSRHARRHGPSPWRKIAYGYANPWENEAHHLALYRRHIEEVQAFFASRPDRLLTVCWEQGDGWERLCGFLGRPVPEAPFPHLNVDGSESWRFTAGARVGGEG